VVKLNLRIRCENCNLQDFTEIKTQPESSGLIPKLFRLKNRSYVHCIACGHVEDFEISKKRMLEN